MRSRMLAIGILIVVVLLALAGCEALDQLEGTPGPVTPGVETPGAETDETPGLATPGAGTPATPGMATPGVEITPTVGITPGGALTATAPVTPGVDVTPTEALTPSVEITPTETVTPGVEITPTETVTPGLGITPTETVTPGGAVTETSPSEAPEELNLADLDGLEQYDSYQTTTVVTWTPQSGAPTLIEALVEANVAGGLAGIGREATQHTLITLTESDQPTQTLEFVSRGAQTWARSDSTWAEVAVDPTDLLDEIGWVGNPEALVSEDARGEFVGVETVDGMELWHYLYPFEAISQTQRFADFVDAELHAWVSPDDNVLWRMELNATGTGPQALMGELTLLSQVVSVDEAVVFEVPPELEADMEETPEATPEASAETPGALPQTGEEAPAVLTRNDIPLIEGATNVRVFVDVVVLDVPREPSEVIDWYTNELEGGDWSVAEPRSDTSARLTRDGRVVNIVAAPGQQEGRSTVIITVGEE